MSHYEPKHPFDGYDADKEYPEMMEFIMRVESIQAKGLGEWMIKNIVPKGSVIDVGCGPGLYLTPYKEAGFEVFGIDACPTGGSCLGIKEFLRWDIRFPFHPARDAAQGPFDLAICFEIAEHVEAHWADRIVDTLCDCADLILFSAATPGQGGTYHVNEQPHAYWLDKFKERHGYVIHPKQDKLRAFLRKWEPERQRGEVSGWLIDNSFLLIKEKS